MKKILNKFKKKYKLRNIHNSVDITKYAIDFKSPVTYGFKQKMGG